MMMIARLAMNAMNAMRLRVLRCWKRMYARWLREDGCMRASSTPGLLVSLRPTDATVRALLTLRACATVVILAAASEALTRGHVPAYLIIGEMRNARQTASRAATRLSLIHI